MRVQAVTTRNFTLSGGMMGDACTINGNLFNEHEDMAMMANFQVIP